MEANDAPRSRGHVPTTGSAPTTTDGVTSSPIRCAARSISCGKTWAVADRLLIGGLVPAERLPSRARRLTVLSASLAGLNVVTLVAVVAVAMAMAPVREGDETIAPWRTLRQSQL
jgi:hypothetical protein